MIEMRYVHLKCAFEYCYCDEVALASNDYTLSCIEKAPLRTITDNV